MTLAILLNAFAPPWPKDSMLGPWESEAPGYYASATVRVEGDSDDVSDSASASQLKVRAQIWVQTEDCMNLAEGLGRIEQGMLRFSSELDPECQVSMELKNEELRVTNNGCQHPQAACALTVRLGRPVSHFIEWP